VPQRIGFDLERTMRTRYKIDTYQQTYFVIDSFEQLFDMTAPDFAPMYERLRWGCRMWSLRRMRGVVAAHRACNARVFGSVLHGLDTESSDLDIVVDTTSQTTLMDVAAIQVKLESLLGVSVDVLTPKALPEKFRHVVLAEAMPI
jgi:predicted nucleotidyltransferase